MRLKIASSLLGAAMILGACATTPPNGGGGTVPSYDQVVAQVIQVTTAVCSFVPTAGTVIEILSLGHPALTTATQIATAICGAVVQPRQGAPGTVAKAGTVGGVKVRGRFV